MAHRLRRKGHLPSLASQKTVMMQGLWDSVFYLMVWRFSAASIVQFVTQPLHMTTFSATMGYDTPVSFTHSAPVFDNSCLSSYEWVNQFYRRAVSHEHVGTLIRSKSGIQDVYLYNEHCCALYFAVSDIIVHYALPLELRGTRFLMTRV